MFTTIVISGSRVRQRRLITTLDLKPSIYIFHFETERQNVVHVSHLLQSPAVLEHSIGIVVFRSCNPASTVVCVEPYALFAVGFGDELFARRREQKWARCHPAARKSAWSS
jgi:hypothetical protein